MKKFLLSILALTTLATGVMAQNKLGYIRDVSGAVNMTNFRQGDSKFSGASMDIRANFSLLGMLAFRESKFMIGDHLGAGFGVGFFKKPSDDIPVMLLLGLEFGLKASFAVSDELEFGAKFIRGTATYYTDLDNDFALGYRNLFVPTVRFKNYIGSIGFGKSLIDNADNKPGFMLEGRAILGDIDDDTNGYLFLKIERFSGTDADRVLKASAISIGIGLM